MVKYTAMQKVYFISGIDTGIGKTIATGLMARALAARGVDVLTVKLVQTGNDGFSEDDAGLTAPQIFKFPSSPLLAAQLEGKTVDLKAISEAVRACAARHQVVLVESAGGLHVPLTEDTLTVEFAAAQRWPLILVTCGRLGAINHTLLSLEAAKTHDLAVAGVVHNDYPSTDPRLDADAIAATERMIREAHVDVMAAHRSNDAVPAYAIAHGVYTLANYGDLPDSPLLLARQNVDWQLTWAELLKDDVRKSNPQAFYWFDYNEADMSFTVVSPDVTADERALIAQAEEELRQGFEPFSGDIRDNEGVVRCRAGEYISDETLRESIDWLVEGVSVYE